MKTADRFCGELVTLFDRFLDAKDEDAGQARDAIHAAIEQDRADAQAEPLEVLRAVAAYAHQQYDSCRWCGAYLAAHPHHLDCVASRADALLAGAPSPEPQPTAEQVAEAVREHLRMKVHKYYVPRPGTMSATQDHYQCGVGDALRIIISCDLAPILKKLGVKT